MAGHGANWPWQKTPTSRAIEVERICCDERFQPRHQTGAPTIRKYAAAMQAGSLFPPIKLAQIGDKLNLICGWHRYEAAVTLSGHRKVEAEVVKMTANEALKEAVEDNLTNGTPYTSKDQRRAFGMWVTSGQYKGGEGGRKYKSYREMGKIFGKPYTTLRNWMEKDFKKVFKAIGDDGGGNADAIQPDHDSEAVLIRLLEKTLDQTATYYDALKTPEARFSVVEALEVALEKMKEKPRSAPDW